MLTQLQSERPGLGMEVDWEYVNAHTIATL